MEGWYFSFMLSRLVSDDGGMEASSCAYLLSHASDLYLILLDLLGGVAILVKLLIISLCTSVIVFTIFVELDVLITLIRNHASYILKTPPSDFLQTLIIVPKVIVNLLIVLHNGLSMLGQGEIVLLNGHLVHAFIQVLHHLADSDLILQCADCTVFHSQTIVEVDVCRDLRS